MFRCCLRFFCVLVLSFREKLSSAFVTFQLHVLFNLGLFEVAPGSLDRGHRSAAFFLLFLQLQHLMG